jgi:DNA polymerase III alpha subunit
MDIESHIKSIPLDDDNIDLRIARRDKEIELFRKYGLEDILRLVVFIVDTLKEKNVVWGTGRGSSCSSYLFYIIGLHCVDVIKYDIPIHDFFKQEKST